MSGCRSRSSSSTTTTRSATSSPGSCTDWGHAVIAEAGSVAEALTQADALRPDTVLVDLGLPDGDGFSLARQLRTRSWPMRVVLFSSDGDRANATAARRAGAVGFVRKDELSGPGARRLVEIGIGEGDGGE